MRPAEPETKAVDTTLAPPLLEVADLTVGYPVADSYFCPVDGLSMTIREREIVGLIGDAGSGKSTVALALLGLARAPGRILSGSVFFQGQDLLALDDAAIRRIRGRDIGIIVQSPRKALNPMLRIGRQIGYAYQAHNTASDGAAQHKAIEMLRKVGINDPERRSASYAHELSGGMAQRALIAMALSSKPKLLIADEPTSGLDVTIQAQFLDEMWQTVQETGSSILLVTQELGIIANYCDRVLVLHEGRIVEDAPVRTFFANPRHEYSKAILGLQRDRRDAAEVPGQAPAPAPLVEAHDLTKHFPLRRSDKKLQAVDHVSFTVGRSETLGLVGESGSGKTTVGRCLIRLEEPTSGRIVYDGMDISALSRGRLRDYRSRIQIVLQDPFDSLNPRWTMEKTLSEALDLHGRRSRAGKRARCEELLNLVGLDASILKRKPRGIGAGALQRVSIARALACDPEFIVLDEPTSVLSPRARVALIELLRRLQKELGLSYLFISHDLTTVRNVCDRIAVMYLGQIVETGTVEQIFSSPRHPYSAALLSAHLVPDPSLRRVDRAIPAALQGEIPSPIDLPAGCYLAGRCPYATEACRSTPQVMTELADGRSVRCHRVAKGEIDPSREIHA